MASRRATPCFSMLTTQRPRALRAARKHPRRATRLRAARALVATATALVLAPSMTVAPAAAVPGELDASFGAGGATTAFRYTSPLGIALQADGKIVVAGRYQNDVDHDPAFFVGRLRRDGRVDPTFGNGGMVVTDF